MNIADYNGGLYFSLNTFFSFVLLLVGITFYKDCDLTDYPHAISYDEVLIRFPPMCISWLISAVTFYKLCNKDYIRTFLSTQTSAQFFKEKWDWLLENASSFPSLAEAHEAALIHISIAHPNDLKEFEDEIAMFINENWHLWLGGSVKELLGDIPQQLLTGEQEAEIREMMEKG
jgi:hypothetical protein